MSPKQIHLEFMKAALTGVVSAEADFVLTKTRVAMAEGRGITLEEYHAKLVLKSADACLKEYEKRWEKE